MSGIELTPLQRRLLSDIVERHRGRGEAVYVSQTDATTLYALRRRKLIEVTEDRIAKNHLRFFARPTPLGELRESRIRR